MTRRREGAPQSVRQQRRSQNHWEISTCAWRLFRPRESQPFPAPRCRHARARSRSSSRHAPALPGESPSQALRAKSLGGFVLVRGAPAGTSGTPAAAPQAYVHRRFCSCGGRWWGRGRERERGRGRRRGGGGRRGRVRADRHHARDLRRQQRKSRGWPRRCCGPASAGAGTGAARVVLRVRGRAAGLGAAAPPRRTCLNESERERGGGEGCDRRVQKGLTS